MRLENSETVEQLKEKAHELYESFDKNNDNHISLEELKEGVKSGLGLDSDDDSDDE